MAAFAVGDTAFQKKCADKINEFKAQGKTIVFVSHALDTVKSLCQRTLLINNGKMVSIGNTEEVINQYLKMM